MTLTEEESSPKNKSVKVTPSKKNTPRSSKKNTPRSSKKNTPRSSKKNTPRSSKKNTPRSSKTSTPRSATPIKQLKWSTESFQILSWLRKNIPEEYEKYFEYLDDNNNKQLEIIESYRDMWIKATSNDLKDLEYIDVIRWLKEYKPDEYSEFEKLPILEKKEFINNNKDRWIRETNKLNDLVILLNLPKTSKETPITVPKTVTENVESFMQIFTSIEKTASPQTKGIVRFSGMEKIVKDLFYIRLLEKYKNDCVLPNIKLGYIFTNTMTSKDISILANNIINCVKRGTHLFIIPIGFFFSNNTGHANMFIYRVNITDDKPPTHVIEHFEPHGAVFQGRDDEEAENTLDNIQNKVLELLEEIKKIYNEKGKPIETEYISPREVCPVIRGIQKTDYSDNFGGFCGLWSFFFAELTVLNPTVSSKVLYSSLIELSRQDTEYIHKILIGYIIKLSEDIFEMFGEIFEITDKKDIIKIIGKIYRMNTVDQNKYIMMIENLRLRVDSYINNKYRDSQDETDNIDYLDKLKLKGIDVTKMMQWSIDEIEPYFDELFSEYKITTGNPPRILVDIYTKIYQEYDNTIKELEVEIIAKEQKFSSYFRPSFYKLQPKFDKLYTKFSEFKKKYPDMNIWYSLNKGRRK